MTPQERMAELIEHGAVITVLPPGISPVEMTLAACRWYDDPPRIRWCAPFPQHQGNVHETEYDKVELENDGRDIVFYKDGRLVAGVVPYEEGLLSLDAVQESLAEWRDLLSRHNNEKQFEEFFEDAI